MNVFEQSFWLPKKEVPPPEAEKRKSPIPSPEETVLTSGKTRGEGIRIETGITRPRFVEIEGGNAGIFKTEGCEQERAAYLVDRFFDFGLVPPTIIKTIGGERGSLQQFIADAPTALEVNSSQIPEEEMQKLRIFDFLTGNVDRNMGNFLIKNGRVFAIDHHLAFQTNKYMLDLSCDIYGKKFPPE